MIALVFMVLALSHGGTPATKQPRADAGAGGRRDEAGAERAGRAHDAAPTAAPTTAKPEPATPEPSAPRPRRSPRAEPSGAAAAPARPARRARAARSAARRSCSSTTRSRPRPRRRRRRRRRRWARTRRRWRARARPTTSGNVKLFAGDTDGAIALYRESLKIYPGYVAGYRGLGLGYEAAGNKRRGAQGASTPTCARCPAPHDAPHHPHAASSTSSRQAEPTSR